MCNVKVDDDLMPPRPDELQAYLGDLLADPAIDVVATRHPDHSDAEYEHLGVDWLLETAWPAEGWLASLRHDLGLDD